MINVLDIHDNDDTGDNGIYKEKSSSSEEDSEEWEYYEDEEEEIKPAQKPMMAIPASLLTRSV